MEQYSAIKVTTALAVPSRSSKRFSSKGNTEFICLLSVRLHPDAIWFVPNMVAFRIETAPSITSSSAEQSFGRANILV